MASSRPTGVRATSFGQGAFKASSAVEEADFKASCSSGRPLGERCAQCDQQVGPSRLALRRCTIPLGAARFEQFDLLAGLRDSDGLPRFNCSGNLRCAPSSGRGIAFQSGGNRVKPRQVTCYLTAHPVVESMAWRPRHTPSPHVRGDWPRCRRSPRSFDLP